MEFMASMGGEPLWRVPFVTSIVLALALSESEPARPRSIIGGQVIACASGLGSLWLLGSGEVASAVAVAVGLATAAMLPARTLHPPAGICAFLITAHNLPFTWVVSPVLVGAILLAAFAWTWNAGERRLVGPISD